MNSLVINLKKSPYYLAYPYIFIASFLFIINFLALFPIYEFQALKNYLAINVNTLFCLAAPAFITFYHCENAKKAITSAFCVLLSDLVLYSLTLEHFSLLYIVILSFFCAGLSKKLDLIYFYLALLFGGMTMALIFGLLNDYFYELLKVFARFVQGKGSLFGVIENFYSIAFTDNFADLFYHKGYSESIIVNNRLTSGAIDIFSADTDSPRSVVSKYLTGKYLLNIFVTIGIFAALYSRFNKSEKYGFVLISLIALIFGDIKLLSLFILLFNPFLYLCYLVLVFICYLVPSMLDIRIGFIENGSIFELFKYGNNWFYFILTGVVIIFLTYFAFVLTLSKFDLQTRKFLPKEVKKIVAALGGDRNIERLTKDRVYVKNPNLIDILKLDCDIHENEITLEYDDLQLLKEYF
ncbi:MAG: hypothetical protein ACLUFN_09025 [Eubacterium sp.]